MDKDGNIRPRGISCDMGAYESLISCVHEGQSIQEVINIAQNGGIIIVFPGVYPGGINFEGKAITVRSTNPGDPNIVRNTIIDGYDDPNIGSLVTFCNFEQENSQLQGFTLKRGNALNGGGIHIYRASPIIRNCNIEVNSAENYGGGIYCDGYDVEAIEKQFPTIPTFVNCNVRHNYSVSCGGGVYIKYANPQFFSCNISENYAGCAGGGIMIKQKSFPYFENCIIDKNVVVSNFYMCDGEAIHVGQDSGHDFIFCTIAENGDGTGSALYYNDNDPNNPGNYKECIIWNNNSEYEISGIGYSPYYTPPIVTYSDIRDPNGYDGEGNINSDPLFVDPNTGNYHLLFDSPCIDAGDPNSSLTIDMDGKARPMGDGYDMGAYEFMPPESLAFSNETIYSGTYEAPTITADPNVTIAAGQTVIFRAQDSISANNNFIIEQEANVTFEATSEEATITVQYIEIKSGAVVTFEADTITAENNFIIRSGAAVTFEATDFIVVGPDFTIESGAEVYLRAGNYIKIWPDFTAQAGCTFEMDTLN